MRQDNEGPQLLGPLNRPTVQVWPFLSGAEANPLFLETLELSPGNFRIVLEILEIVPEILEIVPEILGIVLPCIFNFKAKRTYSVKRPGNRVRDCKAQPLVLGRGSFNASQPKACHPERTASLKENLEGR